ncbi:energy-coupling factor transporter transmembrane component T family protein [Kurthia sibirica]|uniref:Energy-coupling factor transporter transmembrane protein EcfT n=1 Tax=Kurthia sibirica TaxID=202750 RepID=A0A2U3AM52_9BACL|nr:energy-coupling factor transporter transmembrane component T [Kurthia sibirica]PWI25594.1 cobalt ABC transporter permease [Kurthia sibirica]GEK34105.1 energy-coupling factor transporter transmembrane protein EcfT [Kurthia sibirica]
MMEKMIFGRFIPGDSFVHKMDPRAKLVFVFAFILVVFIANNIPTYIALVVVTFFVIALSRIRLYFLINGLKPVMILMVFTFLIHVFFTKGGTVLIDWGIFNIQEEGVKQGIFISIRFLVLVFMTSILTLTTSPISITDGLETLLNPLKKIKVPVHELALMMSIALRFIPTLMDETDKIMKAQMARGSDVTSGTIKERLKAVVPLLIPLFVSAFKRAEDLATAMEVRGYRGGEGRTRYRQLKWSMRDTYALLLLVLFAVGLYYFRTTK